jgi:hypothetical protein
MSFIASGICRHCGCKDGEPCRACQLEHGDVCFTDRTRTVCTASDCERKEANRLRQAQPARPPRRTPGDIEQLIKQELAERRRASRERSKQRKKAKAA